MYLVYWFHSLLQKITVAECIETQSKAMTMLNLEQLSYLLKFALQKMKQPGVSNQNLTIKCLHFITHNDAISFIMTGLSWLISHGRYSWMIYLADRAVSEARVPGTAPGLRRVYISPHGHLHVREGRGRMVFYWLLSGFCGDLVCVLYMYTLDKLSSH